MIAKDATLLTNKMNQLKKMISSIRTDPEHPGSEALKNNSIILLGGLTRDVRNIFENDKRYIAGKKKNPGMHKTGYPCKPIKPRKKRGSHANNSSFRNGSSD